nr:amine GPCR [Hymenolepis microstoma]
MAMNNHDPISKTFWYCIPTVGWPDAVDVLCLLFEVTGFLLNTLTIALLFRIRHGPTHNIIILRTLAIHCLLVSIVNFLEDCNPNGIKPDNYILGTIICVFWNARFFYWIFLVATTQCVTFFSLDRVLTLYKSDQLRYINSKKRIIVYEITIHVFSILITLPQILTVNLKNGGCDCAPNTVNIPFLTIIYAHVFIWYAVLFLLDGGILLCTAYFIVKWVRETPKMDQFDDLNELSFDVIKEHEHNFAQYIGKGYKTASMCVVPLAVSHIITFSYDSTYQFASALGLTTFIINTVPQRIGGLFLIIQANVIPSILLFYLPPLRDFTTRYILVPLHIVQIQKQ